MIRIFFLVCLLFLFSSAARCDERGLFIWSLEDKPVLSSIKQIDEAIAFAKKHSIKTLFVQVYRANQAWFPSRIADSSPYYSSLKNLSQDSLAYLIKKAHQEGIEIHAWMNMLSLSANKEARILKEYGLGILTRNVQEKTVLDDYRIDHQYFLEPSDTRVRGYLVRLIGELLNAYPDLDGLQFDYIRYPDVHPFYGYSKDNIKRFKKARGVKSINEDDPQWKQWKRDQVTELLEMLVKEARSIRPHIHISTTGCLSYSRAYLEALQDWPSWLDSNLIEFVTLMNYPSNLPEYEKNIMDIKAKVKDFKKVNMAVGTYKFVHTPEIFKKQFQYCEQSASRSCVIFHYNDFLINPELEKGIEKN